MVDYKCGHKTDGVIILDDNLLSMSAYLDWVSSVGLNGDKSQCWECYCKSGTQDNKQVNSPKKSEGEVLASNKNSPSGNSKDIKGVGK